MSTKILYYEDTYLEKTTAQVIAVDSDENGQFIILDQTNFYPQGGGQPTDTGAINHDESVFGVTKVSLQPDGTIYHYGSFQNDNFSAGDEVDLKININLRLLHAKNHTAGHLLAFEAEKLYPGLIAKKGYHFPDGAYVEFEGSLSDNEKETAKETLQEAVRKQIAAEEPIKTRVVSVEELKKLCQHIPENLPTNKPTRAMIVNDQALGCGGTHLSNTREVGNFSIRKIKTSKGTTRISYTLS